MLVQMALLLSLKPEVSRFIHEEEAVHTGILLSFKHSAFCLSGVPCAELLLYFVLKINFGFVYLGPSSFLLSLTPSVSLLRNATFLSLRHLFKSFDVQGLFFKEYFDVLWLIVFHSVFF